MVFPQSSPYPRSLKNRAPAAFLGYRKKKAVFSRVKNRLGFAGKQRVREQGRPKGFPPAFRASRFASLSEPLFLDKKIDRPPLSFKRRRSCSPRGTTLIALLSRASLFTSGRMPNAAPVTGGTGTAYYPFEVQRAAQGRFSFFSPAASHHPAAL